MRKMLLLMVVLSGARGFAAEAYTPLIAVEAPRVIASAEAFDANWVAENLLQEGHAEYASKGKGTETFVDFDLGAVLPVAAFRHRQRNNAVDLIAESELLFSGTPDFADPVRVPVKHVDEGHAVTVATFEPVAARYVRWRVTKVVRGTSPNLGGKGVAFYRAGEAEAAPGRIALSARAPQIFKREGERLVQDLEVTLESPYRQEIPGRVSLGGGAAKDVTVRFGRQVVVFPVEGRDAPREERLSLVSGGETLFTKAFTVPAMLKRVIYVLPHSHTDIGYTDLQTVIEAKQVENLRKGIAAARRTAGYPEGCRFVWNVEVGWAADLYLQRADEAGREAFYEAVRSGQVALEGMYLNVLTGLCRPEELLRLFRFGKAMEERTGVAIDTAMISDVPGFTWGVVTAMAQAGIRYFSVAPNFFSRIGDLMVEWENRPFWWVGPDGQSKVLVWIPYMGYATSHVWKRMSEERIRELCAELERRGYPYEIAHLRWSGIEGDNAEPDAAICDDLRRWNEAYAYPRFVIASTHEAFAAFDARYGDAIPSFSGEWSPYWEDGAGSSAAETAMNRHTATRLKQAETIFALRAAPGGYPAKNFEAAWNNTLLYSEHTWGAHCSISQPESDFTQAQWRHKQGYARAADKASRDLLDAAAKAGGGAAVANAVDVYNTSSWTQSGVVIVPAALSQAGDKVTREDGLEIMSQRMSNGDLAVMAGLVDGFSRKRFFIHNGPGHPGQMWNAEANAFVDFGVKAVPSPPSGKQGWSIRCDYKNGGTVLCPVRVGLDEQTGGIASLSFFGQDDLVDASTGRLLNEYLYFTGSDAANVQKARVKKISVKEKGPLVASLLVDLDAPGCNSLTQEIRVTINDDAVELINRVDKARLPQGSNYHESKESVSFAFPFNVPDGEVRMDVPFGVFSPLTQQLPGACKNWLAAGSRVSVASDTHGVTLVAPDTPLMQIGGLTANLLNSRGDPARWRKTIEPTQAIYPWAMNNHWDTNYRAYQEGLVEFRFKVYGCGKAMAGEAADPLIVLPAHGEPPDDSRPLVAFSTREQEEGRLANPLFSLAVVTALKPSDDGKARIIRLFNPADKTEEVKLKWRTPQRVFMSGVGERKGREVTDEFVRLRKFELLTLRVEEAQ
ncbi:MAG: hypothetical protein FWG50_12955 [Kiritimatiellaeota bacterium]|nr:hypothetical protein [Kiritimatiellota bacterium]